MSQGDVSRQQLPALGFAEELTWRPTARGDFHRYASRSVDASEERRGRAGFPTAEDVPQRYAAGPTIGRRRISANCTRPYNPAGFKRPHRPSAAMSRTSAATAPTVQATSYQRPESSVGMRPPARG